MYIVRETWQLKSRWYKFRCVDNAMVKNLKIIKCTVFDQISLLESLRAAPSVCHCKEALKQSNDVYCCHRHHRSKNQML